MAAATYPSGDERRHVDMQDFSTSLGLFYTPTVPQIEEQYRTFFEVADGFARAVARRTQQFAMVLFPTRLQASRREWNLFLKFYFLDTDRFDMVYPNRRILMFCHEHALACWDLLPSFQQHYTAGDAPLYMPHGDMHFNDAGQELAAQRLVSFLKRQSEGHGLAWRHCIRNDTVARSIRSRKEERPIGTGYGLDRPAGAQASFDMSKILRDAYLNVRVWTRRE